MRFDLRRGVLGVRPLAASDPVARLLEAALVEPAVVEPALLAAGFVVAFVAPALLEPAVLAAGLVAAVDEVVAAFRFCLL